MWEGMVTEAACGEQHFLMAGDHPRYSTRVLVLHPYSSPTGKCFFSPISQIRRLSLNYLPRPAGNKQEFRKDASSSLLNSKESASSHYSMKLTPCHKLMAVVHRQRQRFLKLCGKVFKISCESSHCPPWLYLFFPSAFHPWA